MLEIAVKLTINLLFDISKILKHTSARISYLTFHKRLSRSAKLFVMLSRFANLSGIPTVVPKVDPRK